MIEELLKQKSQLNIPIIQNAGMNNRPNETLHRRWEDLNRGYVELIKKYKVLEREKANLQINLEEVCRANKMLESEFDGLFK